MYSILLERIAEQTFAYEDNRVPMIGEQIILENKVYPVTMVKTAIVPIASIGNPHIPYQIIYRVILGGEIK